MRMKYANEKKIKQLIKCQKSKSCVIIDGFEYENDMDIIANGIKHYTKQNERSLLHSII